MNQIIDDVKKNPFLPTKATIVLGFSGGPDSITLLHILAGLALERELTLIPVHVNHQLREKANQEEDRAVEFCRELGFPCVVRRIDCQELAEQQGISLEEAGRDARYRIFAEVAEEVQTKQAYQTHDSHQVAKENSQKVFIAVAHNADDQCETLLQRILRGTGIHGLAGIPFIRQGLGGYPIIRPLRNISRQEIENYVQENHLQPNYDESNLEPVYLRNRIRLELLPYLEQNYNPSLRQALLTLGNIASEEDDYMEEMAEQELRRIRSGSLSESQAEICLDVPSLRLLHPALKRRVIAKSFRELGNEEDLKYVTVSDILKLAEQDHPSAGIDLPGKGRAERQYEKLILRWNAATASSAERCVKPLASPKVKVYVSGKTSSRPQNPYGVFDYGKVRRELGGDEPKVVIRSRQPGDQIGIGGGKHKSIQNILVDAKVPRKWRNQVFLAAVGREVLWILPSPYFPSERHREKGRFSQNYQIDDNSNELLFLELTDSM